MLPKIDTVLYCTGLGRNTQHIFRYAYLMAGRLGARIVALHVIETLSSRQRALVEGYSGSGSLTELLDQAKAEAERTLPRRIEEFVKEEDPDADWHEICAQVVVAEGHVAETILAHVRSSGADLVVVGVHGEESMTLGSTARRLVKECPVPVLSVQVPEGS